MKDIFVDDCVAVRMENPLDPNLIGFTRWLSRDGVLVTSKKVLGEYGASLSSGGSSTFLTIVERLGREGRVNFISNEQLKGFRFSKATERTLGSNRKDWPHIKAVILSSRKLALSYDVEFCRDVNEFPRVRALASRNPSDLRYDK